MFVNDSIRLSKHVDSVSLEIESAISVTVERHSAHGSDGQHPASVLLNYKRAIVAWTAGT